MTDNSPETYDAKADLPNVLRNLAQCEPMTTGTDYWGESNEENIAPYLVEAAAEIEELRKRVITRQPLTEADIDNLKDLCKSLLACDDLAEQAEIILSIREIANNEPMELVEPTFDPTAPLRLWMAYVAERVWHLRRVLHISQQALAEAAGLDGDVITKIECGELSPSHETLEKIASALYTDYTGLIPFEWDAEPEGTDEDSGRMETPQSDILENENHGH